MPAQSRLHAIKGSERPRSERSRLLGALDSNEQLYITFILRSRPDGPPLPDQEHWRKTPPGKRTFLSPREFAEKYGASQADLDVVANFAASHGMTVVEKQVGPAVVVACGTAAQMNAAFGITLNRYESPRHVSKRPRRDGRHEKKHAEATTQVYRGFDGSVHIPAELAAIVTAVFGLDNRNRRRHQRHRRPVGEYISRRAYPRPNVQLPQHRRGKPNNSFACPPVGADQTCIQPTRTFTSGLPTAWLPAPSPDMSTVPTGKLALAGFAPARPSIQLHCTIPALSGWPTMISPASISAILETSRFIGSRSCDVISKTP